MSSFTRFRLLCCAFSLCCLVAVLFPGLALSPLSELIGRSRSPLASVRAAILMSAGAAVIFAALGLAWPWILTRVGALDERLSRLSDRDYWMLVLALAFLLRLAVAISLPYEPVSDGLWYHTAALSLSSGEGFAVDGLPTADRPPAYPFLLSLTYRLFGPHPGLAWICGILSALIVIWTTHVIALRLYGLGTARWAALLAAGYPTLVLMTGQVMSDLPFLAGLQLVISLLLFSPACSPGRAVLAGAAVAALTLMRGVALGLVVIIPLIWIIRRPAVKKWVVAVLLLGGTSFLCLVPWMLRNQAIFGRFTLETNLGVNLYLGNHHGASGGFTFDDPVLKAAASLPANEAEYDSDLLHRVGDFALNHPFELLLLLPKKLLHLYILETSAAQTLFQGERSYPPWMRHGLSAMSQLSYSLLLVLFLARLSELLHPRLRPRGIQWAGWLLVSYFTLVCLVFFGQDRFRLPILPWMLIEASLYLTRSAGEMRGRMGPAAL